MNKTWPILFVIACCFIVLLMLCNKTDYKETVPKKAYVALERLAQVLKKDYEEKLNEETERTANALQARNELQAQLTASQNKLTASQTTIHRLIAKIDGAKLEKPDSTWIKVSPHYKDGCDSLRDRAYAQQQQINQYEENGAKLNELMLYEIAERDSAINAQKEFNRKFMSQLDNCLAQLQTAVKQQPRNQVYAGIGIFGNQINPLAGGQVNVSLKTKSNKIFEVTGASVGNTWYGGVGAKFLLSFRK